MNSERDDIPITYPVERALVERAVELLSVQLRTIRRFHKFLMDAAIGFASIVGLLVLTGVAQRTFHYMILGVLTDVLIGLLSIATLGLMLALLAGVPQMGMQWWSSHRLRRIGFTDAALAQPTTWTKRALQFLGPIVAPFGVLLLGVVLIFAFLDPQLDASLQSDPADAATFLVMAGVGLVLVVPHFLSRRRRSLEAMRRIRELTGRLGEALAEGRAGHQVEIRAQDLNFMATMEQARIEREREAAIARARREERRDELVLVNTREALEAIKRLDPRTRVLVREQAAELAHTQPAGAQWNEHSGLWQLAVPDTDVQLGYAVDNDQHQVKLISVVEQR